MALVTVPFPLTAGTKARGSHVRANDDALAAGINSIDNSQIASNADIQGSKLLINSVAGSKLIDDSVPAVKLADDDALGEGCNLSELFAGAAGGGSFPSTNVLANRKQHGGKTIWSYFSIAIGQLGTDFVLDSSIDWRRRLVMVMFEGTVVGTVADLPGGANQNGIAGPFWTGGPGVIGTGQNGGIFYSFAGKADGSTASEALTANIGAGVSPDTLRFFARAADGFLMVRATAIAAGGVAVNAMFMCSPHLGT